MTRWRRESKTHNWKKGKEHPNAKLDDEKVYKIKELINKGYSMTKIAEMFEVGYTAIRSIRDGKAWKHI